MSEPIVCGVFKGGGAKGIAYAGALLALEEDGRRFGAVAGASAGAITAALVASRVTAATVVNEMPDALAGIKMRALSAVVFGRSLFKAEGLREWLDNILRSQLNISGTSERVTFRSLAESDIDAAELFIVAMNLATRAPVVFSAGLTPDVPVADAVLASCAIPGAMPYGRAVVGADDQQRVEALVDGGAYANFPEFVFCDERFRRWCNQQRSEYGLASAALSDGADRLVFGFVLNDRLRYTQAPVSGFLEGEKLVDYDQGSSRTSGSTLQWTISEAFSGLASRLSIAAMACLSLVVLLSQMTVVYRRSNLLVPTSRLRDWPVFEQFGPIIGIAIPTALYLFSCVLVLVMICLAVGAAPFMRTVVPAASASLGVSTGVAPWFSSISLRTTLAGSEEPTGKWVMHVVEVPAVGLNTLSFKAKTAAQANAVDLAHQAVGYQLAVLGSGRRGSISAQRPQFEAAQRQWVRTTVIVGALAAASAGLLFGGMNALMRSAEEFDASTAARMAAGAALGVAAMLPMAGLLARGARRASLRAKRRAAMANPWLPIAFGAMSLLIAYLLSSWVSVQADEQFAVMRVCDVSTSPDGIHPCGFYESGEQSTEVFFVSADFSTRVDDAVTIHPPPGVTPEQLLADTSAVVAALDGSGFEASPAFGREDEFTGVFWAQRAALVLLLAGVGFVLHAVKDHQMKRHMQNVRNVVGSSSATQRG